MPAPAAPIYPHLTIFSATRRDDVPEGCVRYISVDGSVPGASLIWDHHVTGEKINLDAMPELVDATGYDAVCTTLPDTDALASVVAVIFGGKGRLPDHVRNVLLAGSHWCDHLAPHPQLGDEDNRLGRGLLDAVVERLKPNRGPGASQRFERAVREVVACIERGAALPFSDRFREHLEKAALLMREGKITRHGRVALVDLRGYEPFDPLAAHKTHHCPVSVTVDHHAAGGLRYTVGINPDAGDIDLRPALVALAEAEFAHGPPALAREPVAGAENWGGRKVVFGSPWNYGSRLDPAVVVGLVAKAMGWAS